MADAMSILILFSLAASFNVKLIKDQKQIATSPLKLDGQNKEEGRPKQQGIWIEMDVTIFKYRNLWPRLLHSIQLSSSSFLFFSLSLFAKVWPSDVRVDEKDLNQSITPESESFPKRQTPRRETHRFLNFAARKNKRSQMK